MLQLSKNLILAALILGVMPFSESAKAQVNFWETPDVLPVGESLFDFKTGYSSSSEEYSGDGQIVNTGDKFLKQFSWEDLNTVSTEKSKVQSRMKKKGQNLSDVASYLSFDIEESVTSLTPTASFGLSSSWSVGIQMTAREVKRKVKLKKSNTNDDPYLNELSEKAYKKQLTDNGYLTDQTETSRFELGDIQVHSKYNFVRGSNFKLSLHQALFIPATANQNQYDAYSISSQEGQLDVLTGLSASQRLGSSFSFIGGVDYRVQMSDRINGRVPRSYAKASLTEEVDNMDIDMERDLGDVLGLKLRSLYSISSSMLLSLGWELERKFSDNYNGNKYEEEAYKALSENTHAKKQTVDLQASYKHNREFRSPIWFSFDLYSVLSGENASKASGANFKMQYPF